jgi:hypothetical protein
VVTRVGRESAGKKRLIMAAKTPFIPKNLRICKGVSHQFCVEGLIPKSPPFCGGVSAAGLLIIRKYGKSKEK